MQSVSRTGAAILCLAVLALQSSHAQISNTPEMEELAASHGQADFFEIMPQMLEYYTNALKSSPRDGVEITMDLSYGPDARHVMDIHSPQQESGEPRPILVFIHGGGFIQGFKNTNDEIYGNIGNYFARAGYVTVNASYRLAPQHQWPAGIEDMAMLVSWLAGHVEEYGGDPERIFLMGQSAGAVHVAAYVFNEDFHVNNGDDGVAGAILVSGIYSITGSDYDKAYYGEDEGKWPDRAVIDTVEGGPSRCLSSMLNMTRWNSKCPLST